MPQSTPRRAFLGALLVATLGFCKPCTASDFSDEIQRLATHISATYKKPLHKVESIVRYAYHQSVISPTVLLAIIAHESGFDENARSSYGAVGLMQVVPRFHRKLVADHGGPEALHRGIPNIQVGLKVIAAYKDEANGNMAQAMQKYTGNAGYSRSSGVQQLALRFRAIARSS